MDFHKKQRLSLLLFLTSPHVRAFLVLSGLHVVLSLLSVVMPQPEVPGMTDEVRAAQAAGRMVGMIIGMIIMSISQLLVIAGAIAMIRKRGRMLAMAGAIVALIPCLSPCILGGLPFGIWALVIMNRPDVKASFS